MFKAKIYNKISIDLNFYTFDKGNYKERNFKGFKTNVLNIERFKILKLFLKIFGN